MQGAALPAAFAQKIHTVQAVIQDNVRIRTGARIETVQWKRESATAMDAVKTAVKAYWPRLSRMGSVCSPNSMGKNSFLEANEKAGVVYHRKGLNGDYDAFEDVEMLIEFIKTRNRHASDESIPE